MKKTDLKKEVAKKYYHEGMPIKGIEKKLDITRATLYQWLNEEEVETCRKAVDGLKKNRALASKLASKYGVTLPTARKYLRTISEIITKGELLQGDLKHLGFGKAKQDRVDIVMDELGYCFSLSNLVLVGDSKNPIKLTIGQVIDLYTDPYKFIQEREKL